MAVPAMPADGALDESVGTVRPVTSRPKKPDRPMVIASQALTAGHAIAPSVPPRSSGKNSCPTVFGVADVGSKVSVPVLTPLMWYVAVHCVVDGQDSPLNC